MKQHRVAIFAPNPASLYTTAVCELLVRRNVEISTIFVRRFTWRRFRQEFARDGRRLFRKIWEKLVLRERAYNTTNSESIVSFRREHNITAKNVAKLGARHGIKVVGCDTLNDDIVETKLRASPPHLVVFTGGGLIRANILAAAGIGIVNCHAGILPAYRGMDVVEWALLHRDWEQVGCTVHLMDKGLDTGDILRRRAVPIAPGDTIRLLRERIEAAMPAAIVDAVIDLLDGRLAPTAQKLEDGQQYFVMHAKLRAMAEARLRDFAGPGPSDSLREPLASDGT